MEVKVCNSDLLRRIAFNMPRTSSWSIHVIPFLEACKDVATFLGYFGMALRSIQYMIIANVELISKWYKEKNHEDDDDLTMVLVREFKRNEIQMNQATHRLVKCLDFCGYVFYTLGCDATDEDLVPTIQEAYHATMEFHQHRMPNWLFHILVKSSPSKTDIFTRLTTEDDSSYEDTKAGVAKLSAILCHAVCILKEHFNCRWVMDNPYCCM